MTFDNIDINILSIPLKKPITTNIHTLNKMEGILLTLRTSEDIKGQSFIYGLGRTSTQEIKTYITQIMTEKKKRSAQHSQNSAYTYAQAAIDIAMWDIRAKKENKPLYQLIGAIHHSVPVYGTTGWLSLSCSELVSECEKYATLGITGFKIRLGHKEDYARVSAVRKAMGDKFMIILDANQRYSTQEAIHIAHQFSEFNITWLEEPVGNELAALKEVSRASPIPIAAGENMLKFSEFEEACKIQAISILQPDIIRCGGITEFLKIAEITQRYNIALCNHLLPALSVSLLACFRNSYLLEYDNLLPSDIFTQDFSIKEGTLPLPQCPGTGVELTQDALKRYSF